MRCTLQKMAEISSRRPGPDGMKFGGWPRKKNQAVAPGGPIWPARRERNHAVALAGRAREKESCRRPGRPAPRKEIMPSPWPASQHREISRRREIWPGRAISCAQEIWASEVSCCRDGKEFGESKFHAGQKFRSDPRALLQTTPSKKSRESVTSYAGE